MKQIIVLIFFLFLTFIDFANAFSCDRDFRFILAASKNKIKNAKQLTELDLKAQVESLENYAELFRSKKETDDIGVKAYYDKFLNQIESHLHVGHFDRVKTIVETVFRNVEFAYFFIKKAKPLSEKIGSLSSHDRSLSSSDLFRMNNFSQKEMEFIKNVIGDFTDGEELLEKLNDLIIDQNIILAKNYFGYFYYRRHLDSILEDAGETDQRLKGEIETILSSIGVKSVSEKARFPSVFKGEKRPSLDSLENFISSNQHSNLIRLRIIRNFEIARAIFQKKFIDAFFKYVLNVPGIRSSRAVRFVRLFLDDNARAKYFPKIRQVVRSNMDVGEKKNLLKNLNSNTEEELLITFARKVDKRTEDTWKEIHEEAKQSDPAFAKQMREAKAIAKEWGEISFVKKKSYAGKILGLLLGGGVTSYFYFSEDTDGPDGEVNPPGHSVTEIPVEEESEIPNNSSTGSAEASINLNMLDEASTGVHIFDERFENDLRLLENFALGQQGN